MTSSQTAAKKIIELIDSKTLLGAALDCMSDGAQARFENDIAKIIDIEFKETKEE
jgi:hypothetical protein